MIIRFLVQFYAWQVVSSKYPDVYNHIKMILKNRHLRRQYMRTVVLCINYMRERGVMTEVQRSAIRRFTRELRVKQEVERMTRGAA